MQITCGIFGLDSENKLLMCHATNSGQYPGIWSIPKGLPENGESFVAAASRELMEETGIEVHPDDLLQLPKKLYKTKEKTLQPYLVRFKKKAIEFNLKCFSYVEIEEQDPFPEVDRFEWVDISHSGKFPLHESQIRCLGLIRKIIYPKEKK